ncbi:unnamed protein product [Paramecium pentaurelia]|uniref:Dynein heavy chain n=1 Tax=Paramecium pentaurelia TaxID=43138 RepID=A0A8S1TJ69_9CILI|nr:unnamed protein product [Paramecium pentaurelia]
MRSYLNRSFYIKKDVSKEETERISSRQKSMHARVTAIKMPPLTNKTITLSDQKQEPKFTISRFSKAKYLRNDLLDTTFQQSNEQGKVEEKMNQLLTIEQYFLSQGFDFSLQIHKNVYLPIEKFEDDTLQKYSNDQVIEMLKTQKIQIFVMEQNSLGDWFWYRAELIGYSKLFHYQRKNREGRCARIHFIMDFEDKQLYIKKLKQAFYLRDQMDRYLKFNCYVENMPTNDLIQLKSEQKKRIKKRLGFEFPSLLIKKEFIEVNILNLKTQNEIIFIHFLKNSETNQKLKDLLEILNNQYIKSQVSIRNIIQNQLIYSEGILIQQIKTSFQILRQSYFLASISNIKPIQKCLQYISNQIADLLQLELFVYQQQPFEKFKFSQEMHMKTVLSGIKIKWVQEIIEFCRINLQIQNKKSIILTQIQLDRFFQLIRMRLQDALHNFLKINYEKFINYLNKHIPEDVQIQSYSQVHNIYTNQYAIIKPLYTIQIQFKVNEICYSINPLQFKDIIIGFFDQIYESIGDIPDPETRLIEYFQKEFLYEMNGNLKAPEKEQYYFDAIDNLSNKVRKSLFDYLKQFESLQKLQYQKSFEIILAETLILDNREDMKLIDQIPEFIEVGAFLIVISEMKSYFYQLLRKREQYYIEQLSIYHKEDCMRLLNEFANLELKIIEKPQNIEQLVEKREFLEDAFPQKLNLLQQEVQKNKFYFDLLNSVIECQNIVYINFYPIRREDTHKYYRLLIQEQQLLKLAQSQKQLLENQKEEIFQIQAHEQSKFKKKIKQLEQQVYKFQEYYQLEQSKMAEDEMIIINNQFQQYSEEAQRFNKREQLFGLEQTNYEILLQLQCEYKPFEVVWRVNSIWQYQNIKWLNDSLNIVDYQGCEQFFNQDYKQFIQVVDKIQFQEIFTLWKNLKKEIDQFQMYVPILLSLTKNGLRERHFNYLGQLLNIQDDQLKNYISLQKLIDLKIIDYQEECIELGLKAQEEFGIEQVLKQITDVWNEYRFNSIIVKGVQIFKKIDVIQALVDDHLISLELMMKQKNNNYFIQEINTLYEDLRRISSYLEEWNKTQTQIVYMQPIFDSGDILKQLPVEYKKYRQIDKFYKEIIGFSDKVIEFGQQDIQKVKQINNLLDQIHKELGNYLERKKEKFSRFYFISNEEILEILSNGQDLVFLQKYLYKLFENIVNLKMNKYNQIYALQTKDCELKLQDKVDTNNKCIEDWLLEVEQQMKQNVKYNILNRNNECGNQIMMINFELDHTYRVEEDMKQGRDLRIYLMELKDKLHNKNLDVANIILLAHHVEVLKQLIDYNQQLIPFYWSLQLRYYIKSTNCQINSLEASIQYGYEYQGNIERIIITPLTERSLVIFLNALHYKRGGAAVGQTGTGKTETIKDLCKAVGYRCILFNCSELVDYILISQFIKGIYTSQCWSCFDEFNRITAEVLSVAASKLMQYQPDGIFVTMNPNYKGRHEFPDNLKSYFRMASMISPNVQIILSTILSIFGFNEPAKLTSQLMQLISISKDLLSNQHHYDYSLRALKSVVMLAGQLFKQSHDQDVNQQNYILKALKYVFEPKLIQNDLNLFHQLLIQFYPAQEIKSVERDDFSNFIVTSILQQKVSELKQILKLRHGIMIVGPAGSGKSACLEVTLKQTNMTNIRLFPKAMKVSELFGCLNISTLEWEEGVLPSLLKQEQQQDIYIFDGAVETEWIETMNSALDNSKRLCLTNGCIINLNCSMIFEVDSLKGATPSTISRCGILYISDDPLLGLKQFISNKCDKQASKYNEIIEKLRSKIIQLKIPLSYFSNQLITIMKEIQNEYHNFNLQLFIYCLAWTILPQVIEKNERSNINQYLINLGNILCDNLLIYNEYKEDMNKFQLIHVPTILKFTNFEDIYVPKIEDMAYLKISQSLLNRSNIRFEGISGAGKTKLINEILHNFQYIRINCSSSTNSSNTQMTLESNLERRRKGVFGPQMGQKCIIVLDDFHMPQDVELVRQFLHQKGWYSKRDTHSILQKVEDTTILAAMTQQHQHSDRMLRLWTTFKFCQEETIYQTIFSQMTQAFQMQHIVQKTLQAYKQIKEQIKATPFKVHYQFTMRDVWRVLQSMCTKKTQNEYQWNFEMARVFVDRLITKQDKILAQSIIGVDTVQFCEFSSGYNDHSYKAVNDLDTLLQLMKEQFQKQGITIYEDALKSLIAISRVLGLQSGHLVILGQVGTGGVQLSKLAVLIQENESPQIDRWKDDLRNIIKKCIMENKKMTIIIDDQRNAHNQPQIYQDISTLLNSGDLDIFNRQELDDLHSIFQEQALQEQKDSKINLKILLHKSYVNRLVKNLHCIVCITSTIKFRHYPNLINCSTILALQQLPDQALLSIAQMQLKHLDINQKQMSELFKLFHQSAQLIDNHQKIQTVTSIHFQDLIFTFNKLYQQKTNELQSRIIRIKNGLSKIQIANETITELKKELLEITPEIEKSQQESSRMMEKLKQEKDQAFYQESLLSEDETQANVQQIQATKLANEATQAVKEVNLLLDQTLQDVSKLKKEHLIEIKSLGKPPKPVVIILTGVVILNLDNLRQYITQPLTALTNQEYFEIAKKYLLNDPKELLELIRNYDKNNINPYNINRLEKIVLSEPDFTFERAKQCSAAVKYLYSWVKAMYEYNKVYIETKPLRERLIEAQKQLKDKTDILNEKKSQLTIVFQKVKVLQEKYDQQTQKCEFLNKQLEESSNKLQRAIGLTSGLEQEQQRWSHQINVLQNSLKSVLGDCAIAAAYLNYCAPLSEQLKHQLLQQWSKQVKAKIGYENHPLQFLNPSQIQDLNQINSIFLQHTIKPILCIDPQCQANEYIRNNNQVMDVNDQHQFEVALSLKQSILIENLNNIPDWLTEYINNNPHPKIKIYVTTMQYNFQMTSLNYSQFYVINFQITKYNAEELILNQIVNTQNPELYKQQVELKQMEFKNEQKLKQIEDTILSILNVENIKDLLNQETLINQLSNSKKTFNEIQLAQSEFQQIQKDLITTKHQYKQLASKITDLYFISQDMQCLDPMYQFSLEWFITQLLYTIKNTNNLKLIFSNFRLRYYSCLSRVLTERHRLVLAFLLAKQCLVSVDHEDWQAFIGYSKLKTDDFQAKINPFTWIDNANYQRICSELNHFQLVTAKILINNFEQIKQFYLSKKYQETEIPHLDRLDEMQRIFIVKAIRPDYIQIMIKQFIYRMLDFDIDKVQSIPLDITFNESQHNKILLYVLQNNQDPIEQIKDFAVSKNFNKKLWTLSLGQGQGNKAERLIREAAEQGLWIVIQNCHLHQQWLNELDKLIMIESHVDYRLWLTSKSIIQFPGRILQKSVKLTYNTNDEKQIEMTDIAKFHFGLLNFCKLGLLGFNKKYQFTQYDLNITQEQSNKIDVSDQLKPIALTYITSQLHYGGHIVDEQDQIILNKLCCYYLIDKVSPVNSNLIQIYVGEQMCQEFVNDLLYKEYGQIDQINDEINKTILYLSSNLPKQIIFDNSRNHKLDPFLVQEILLINQLIELIEESISLIQRILTGDSSPNTMIAEDIKYQRVPQEWMDIGFRSDKKLGQWFQEFLKRVNFINNWNDQGIPNAIWLGGLMKPNSFLMYAKYSEECLNKKTIYTILDSIQIEHITNCPANGYYLYGLTLQGAKWNQKQHILVESNSMLNEFPICYLNYKEDDEYQLFYSCPLYRLIDRKELVAFIPMPCDTTREWILILKSLVLRQPKENLKRLHPVAQQKREQYSQTPEPLQYKTREESPFRILRSQNGNLPVYKKYFVRSEVPRTVIRHIEGDVNEFIKELRKVCSNADVIEKVGRVEVNGSHTISVRKWLTQLGF